MYHHILIPTDGSPLSTVAVEHGMDLARDADAKVTVLTVVSPFHVFSADASQLIPHLIDQNSCAHWRSPMDMIFQGRSTSVFQA
jgi:nucleotide-binding universal stress UspA family protein